MKTRAFLVLFILCFLFNCYPFLVIKQNSDNSDKEETIEPYEMGQYNEGAEVYVFADNAGVFRSPSVKADIIAMLKHSMTVKIAKSNMATEDKGDYSLSYPDGNVPDLKVRGYKESWYKVEAEKGGKKVTGFIWGGALAKAALRYDTDSDGK